MKETWGDNVKQGMSKTQVQVISMSPNSVSTKGSSGHFLSLEQHAITTDGGFCAKILQIVCTVWCF